MIIRWRICPITLRGRQWLSTRPTQIPLQVSILFSLLRVFPLWCRLRIISHPQGITIHLQCSKLFLIPTQCLACLLKFIQEDSKMARAPSVHSSLRQHSNHKHLSSSKMPISKQLSTSRQLRKPWSRQRPKGSKPMLISWLSLPSTPKSRTTATFTMLFKRTRSSFRSFWINQKHSRVIWVRLGKIKR